jgi:hypothetical protein
MFCPKMAANVSPTIMKLQAATTIGLLYRSEVTKHPSSKYDAPLKRLISRRRKNEPKKSMNASFMPLT